MFVKYGKLHGRWNAWTTEGRLFIVAYYKNDKVHGMRKDWSYQADRLLSICRYKSSKKSNNSRPCGKWTYWNLNGKKEEEYLFSKHERFYIYTYNKLGGLLEVFTAKKQVYNSIQYNFRDRAF